jgi:hypothetical protein
MLTNPTIDMLRELGLHGMAIAFQELDAQSEARGLEHGEWLAILLEREATMRRQKRFEAEPGLPGCAMMRRSRMPCSPRP